MAKRKTASPRPQAPADVATDNGPVAAGPALVHDTGTELVAGTPPSTEITFRLDIKDLVAVGVVHAETLLTAKLKQEVAEASRLASEANIKTTALRKMFDDAEIDPEFRKDCNALVAAAKKLGLTLTVEFCKTGFDAGSLAYTVVAQLRGIQNPTRAQALGAEAVQLRDEIAGLVDQHRAQAQVARETKDKLNIGQLERLMQAGMAQNAMSKSREGDETIRALLAYIERAIGIVPSAHHRLGSD